MSYTIQSISTRQSSNKLINCNSKSIKVKNIHIIQIKWDETTKYSINYKIQETS